MTIERNFIKHYFSAKKPLVVKEGTELAKQVSELEEIISQPLDMFGDPDIYEKYQKINRLNLEERRLMIVFSLYDGSVNRVATLFGVDRKTISNRVEDIMKKINR